MAGPELIKTIESASIVEGIRLLAAEFPGGVVFSSSLGQEDQLLTDIIFRNDLPVKVFTIDTGRLFNETYELLDRVSARYKKSIEVYFPESAGVENYVRTEGINGFYESPEKRKSCCYVRKVEPLNRALKGARVWITGLRADQSDNRKSMPMIEWSEERELFKYNPPYPLHL